METRYWSRTKTRTRDWVYFYPLLGILRTYNIGNKYWNKVVYVFVIVFMVVVFGLILNVWNSIMGNDIGTEFGTTVGYSLGSPWGILVGILGGWNHRGVICRELLVIYREDQNYLVVQNILRGSNLVDIFSWKDIGMG